MADTRIPLRIIRDEVNRAVRSTTIAVSNGGGSFPSVVPGNQPIANVPSSGAGTTSDGGGGTGDIVTTIVYNTYIDNDIYYRQNPDLYGWYFTIVDGVLTLWVIDLSDVTHEVWNSDENQVLTVPDTIVLGRDPTGDAEAATKKYVDDHAGGGGGGSPVSCTGSMVAVNKSMSFSGAAIDLTGLDSARSFGVTANASAGTFTVITAGVYGITFTMTSSLVYATGIFIDIKLNNTSIVQHIVEIQDPPPIGCISMALILPVSLAVNDVIKFTLEAGTTTDLFINRVDTSLEFKGTES